MEGIIFYKLVSPYPEDTTKDCKLSMADMDSNFLAFKNNDISAATFNDEAYSIDLTRNNGDNISIDISSIKEYIDQQSSGKTSGDTPTLSNIDLELSSDGVLTLSWTVGSATTKTSVSGFVTSVKEDVVDSVTIDGKATDKNPLRVSNLEKTSAYKNVIAIVENLPDTNIKSGDRYVTSKTISNHGVLYTRSGVDIIKQLLVQYGLLWRVPTKDDWDKLCSTLDQCEDSKYFSDEIDIEQGKFIGKTLKANKFWNESGNTDSIGFSIYPTYSADEFKSLVDEKQNAIFWTDTPYSGDTYYLKEFSVSADTVSQIASTDKNMYSLRLVMDYDSNETGFDANIFGDTYKIINIPQIKQLWILSNIGINLNDEDYSLEFDYSGATINTKYNINHFNGTIWEKKQLENGDTITVGTSDYIKEYKVFDNGFGNSSLAKSCEMKNGRVILDSGWY